MIRFNRLFRVASSAVAMVVLAAGCSKTATDKPADSSGAASTPAGSASLEAALIDSGTVLLYRKKDPVTALPIFEQILKANPKHYGAHYQLAVALDSSGRVAEAKSAWEAFLPMAQEAKDTAYAGVAQRRLSAPVAPLTEAQLMNLGLYELYTKGDGAAAAEQFKELLRRRHDHYGATYQLAVALDKQGKPTEARPLWQKVLKMAQDIKDQATIATAEKRLAQNP